MVKVKALRPHGNRFGDKYDKDIGDEYEVFDPTALIDAKLVEKIDGDGKNRGSSRAGKSAAGATEGDGA